MLHFDMDCFYCQVEARRLGVSKAAPLVVDQWGMLLSVNYSAKALGITRKTPAREAASVGAIVAHVCVIDIETGETFDDINSAYRDRAMYKANLDRYREASEEVMTVMKQVIPIDSNFERASIDECYTDIHVDDLYEMFPDLADVSKLHWEGNMYDPGKDGALARGALLGERIRAEVLAVTGFTVSCGVSETRQVAKLSCALNKPDKLTVVSLSRTTSFMRTVPLKEVRGLGPRAMETLQARVPWATGHTPCGDLWNTNLGNDEFAKWLYEALRGLNDTPVKDTALVASSVQASKQFRPGLPLNQLDGMLKALTADMIGRLGSRPAKSLVVILQSGDTVRSRQDKFPSQDVDKVVSALATKTCLLTGTYTFDRIAVTAKDVDEAPISAADEGIAKAKKDVAEYLSASRLHFMGTWRTRYLQYIHEVDESGVWEDGTVSSEAETVLKKFDLVSSLSVSPESWFLLVDMDCFFCSVSMATNGIEESVPCAVASGMGPTSEICSANYPARKYGVRASSFVSTAKDQCPQIKIFSIDTPTLTRCEVVWKQVIHVLCLLVGSTARVNGKSCDEALVDLSGLIPPSGENLHVFLERIGRTVQEQVIKETGIPCSVGIGPSRILAKIATSKAKPKGVKLIKSVLEGADMLYGDSVKTLPGVGYSTNQKLLEMGIETVGDLLRSSERLPASIGAANAKKLIAIAQGIDLAEDVVKEIATVSAEKNFGLRNLSTQQAADLIEALGQSVLGRCPPGAIIEKVVLRLKMAGDDWVEPAKKGGIGEVYDFSRTVAYPGGSIAVLLVPILGEVDTTRIRGIGVTAKLKESAAQERKRGRDQDTLDKWFNGERFQPESLRPKIAVSPVETRAEQVGGITDFCVVCGTEVLLGSLTSHFISAHLNKDEVCPCPICGDLIEVADSGHVATHFITS